MVSSQTFGDVWFNRESLGVLEVQVPQKDLQGSRRKIMEMGSVNILKMGRSNPSCLVGQRGRRSTLARLGTAVS